MGDGGLGKTTTVLKLLNDPDIKKVFPARISVSVGKDCKGLVGAQNIIRYLLTQELKVDQFIIKDCLKYPTTFRQQWQAYESPVLLALDDVWDAEALAGVLSYLPDTVSTVITVRDETALSNAQLIPDVQMDFLQPDEAEAVFRLRLGTLGLASKLKSNDIQNVVGRVYGHIGCIVALAGTVKTLDSFKSLIRNLEDRGLAYQASWHTEANNNYTQTIAIKVFKISWQAIADAAIHQSLLKLCDLPVSLMLALPRLANLLSPLDEATVINHLERLRTLNLLITHDVSSENFKEDQYTIYQLTGWTRELAPKVADELKVTIRDLSNWADKLNGWGLWLMDSEDFVSAYNILHKVLTIRETRLEKNYANIIYSKSNLATLYKDIGYYEESKLFYQEALNNFYEQRPDLSVSAISTIITGIADVYRVLGDFKNSQIWYNTTIAAFEKHLGQEHLMLTAVLNNFAVLCIDTFKYENAKRLLFRSLNIQQKQLGNVQFDTIAVLNNLAQIFHYSNNFDQAETLFKFILEEVEKIPECKQKDIATIQNNLAGLYIDYGKYKEAEPLYLKALNTWQNVFGLNHDSVATCQNNLAELYMFTERYDEAGQLYKQALKTIQERLGCLNPTYATVLYNLGRLYHIKKQCKKAEVLYKKALFIREECLEQNHISVVESLSKLADLYMENKEFNKAEPLYYKMALNFMVYFSKDLDIETPYGELIQFYIICELTESQVVERLQCLWINVGDLLSKMMLQSLQKNPDNEDSRFYVSQLILRLGHSSNPFFVEIDDYLTQLFLKFGLNWADWQAKHLAG